MGHDIDIKIATITLTTRLPDCELHLINIGKYLEIDDEILGIKYNYAKMSIIKGKYLTTIYKKCKTKKECKINKVLFYNQVSMIVNNGGNSVNVKLFKNGSLHLTGCKSVNEGDIVTKIVYKKLDEMRNKSDIILLTKDINGVLLDNDNLVYSYKKKNIIGYVDNKEYIINKKSYVMDEKTEMFISSKVEKQRKKMIYNLDGEYIGYSQIELMNNRNKFYKRNTNSVYCDKVNDLIYYNDKILIGKVVYSIDDSNVTQKEMMMDIMEVVYDCNPFVKGDYRLNGDDVGLSVNCMNVYFNLNYTINRQRLYDKLIERGYICKYSPETYSGIRLIYKFPLSDNDSDNSGSDNNSRNNMGMCYCSTKCTCLNVTFLIFQSGNVICTGLRSDNDSKMITDYFIEMCSGIKESIQKKTLIKI